MSGTFEVRIWRVLLVDGTLSKIVKRGIVAVVRGPEGTEGSFGWGDENEETGFQAEIFGGQTKAWVRWESSDETEKEMVTEELDMDEASFGTRTDEKWYEERIVYKGEMAVVYDYTFRDPVMEEREAGVVDFDVLERGYVKPWDWVKGEGLRTQDL